MKEKELSTLQNPQFLGTAGVRTVFNIQVLACARGMLFDTVFRAHALVCLTRA